MKWTKEDEQNFILLQSRRSIYFANKSMVEALIKALEEGKVYATTHDVEYITPERRKHTIEVIYYD